MVETVFLVFLVFLLAVFFFLTDDGQENPAPFYCASLISEYNSFLLEVEM